MRDPRRRYLAYEVDRLRRAGRSQRQIAKALMIGRKKVRTLFRELAEKRVEGESAVSREIPVAVTRKSKLDEYEDRIREWLRIDEVGLEQVERLVATRAGLMQKVLLPRYEERRSTIITSNIDWKDWGRYLGDELGAAAILDRLIHHSHVIVIEGPSWRDHTHKKDVSEQRKKTAKKEKRPARDRATEESWENPGKSPSP